MSVCLLRDVPSAVLLLRAFPYRIWCGALVARAFAALLGWSGYGLTCRPSRCCTLENDATRRQTSELIM